LASIRQFNDRLSSQRKTGTAGPRQRFTGQGDKIMAQKSAGGNPGGQSKKGDAGAQGGRGGGGKGGSGNKGGSGTGKSGNS
jgi:hypothetical protein